MKSITGRVAHLNKPGQRPALFSASESKTSPHSRGLRPPDPLNTNEKKEVIFIKGRQPKEKRPTITIRLDQPEKDKIERLAKRCGLSVTEYLILRGTGYEPKIVPYDAVFTLIKRLDELIDKDISPEVNAEAMTVLKAVTASLVYPIK